MLVRIGLSALVLVALATTTASAGTSAPAPGGVPASPDSSRPLSTATGTISAEAARRVGEPPAEGHLRAAPSPWNSSLLFDTAEHRATGFVSALAIESMEMVPLPGAAISGLVVLGGIGLVAVIRRRRRRRHW